MYQVQIHMLILTKGEIIIGNSESSSGWLTGHIGSREGIFPASYVWQLDPSILKVYYYFLNTDFFANFSYLINILTILLEIYAKEDI